MTKMPPNNPEVERAVLGCALRSAEALASLQVLVQASDFYAFANRKLWEVFSYLAQKGAPVDAVTVFDRVVEMRWDEDVLAGYIAEIWDGAPALGNFKHYANLLRGFAVKRAFSEAGVAIEALAHDPSLEVGEMCERAESALFQASRRQHGLTEAISLQQAVAETAADMDRRVLVNHGDDVPLPMGWNELDILTGGFQREELTILGARPSIGKTVFCMNVIDHLAFLGKRIFFASLEQPHMDVANRFLCRHAKVSMLDIRNPARIDNNERLRLSDAMLRADNLQVYIDSHGNQTASRIASQARRLAIKAPLDLIAVDYLGLIEPENRQAQRYVQVGQNCQRMKQLAKELKVPVLLLAQVSRDTENRRPNLSDLRESGDIEQHADCVLMLHRPEEQDRTRASEPLEVLIRKQRNGPLGEVKLLHFKRHFDLQPFLPV